MATLQKCRPAVRQSTETQSLFTTDLRTELQSAQFVKKLLAVSVSNVMYLRAVFPESSFAERQLDGLRLKVLRDDSHCPNARRLADWVKACFEAIDKHYLRQLSILLYRDESQPDCVLETYTFRFAYNKDGAVTMQHGDLQQHSVSAGASVSTEKTYQSTIRMFRAIMVLCQNLSSLPDNCFISMKLLYYDDVTPVDYEPTGFRASDTQHVYFESKAVEVRLGDVATQHHGLRMRIKTTDARLLPEDEDEQQQEATAAAAAATTADDVTTEPAVADNVQQDVCPSCPAAGADAGTVPASTEAPIHDHTGALSHQHQPLAADSVCYQSPDMPVSAVGTTGTAAVSGVTVEDSPPHVSPPPSQQQQLADGADGRPGVEKVEAVGEAQAEQRAGERVRCPCGVHEDDGLMVFCDICHCWQHGICFLIFHDGEAPASHVCDQCALTSGRSCTDTKLPPLSLSTRMATCLYRRGLCACEEFGRISVAGMARRMGVDRAVAEGLMRRLEKDGVLTRLSSRGEMRRVNKTVLFQQTFPRYLNRSSIRQPISPATVTVSQASSRQLSPAYERQNTHSLGGGGGGDISERTGRLRLTDESAGGGDCVAESGDSQLDSSLVIERCAPSLHHRRTKQQQPQSQQQQRRRRRSSVLLESLSSQDFEPACKKRKVSRVSGIHV